MSMMMRRMLRMALKMTGNSQEATSRSHFCSSRGKRARCIEQAHVIDTLMIIVMMIEIMIMRMIIFDNDDDSADKSCLLAMLAT